MNKIQHQNRAWLTRFRWDRSGNLKVVYTNGDRAYPVYSIRERFWRALKRLSFRIAAGYWNDAD